MKPPAVPLEAIRALPAIFRQTIPESFQDENGHMNMRWYLALFDDAGYPLAASFGLTSEFHARHGSGGYDLEHHLHYLREIMIGDDVAIHARLLGRSAKRIHYMMFMVNETRGTLAATFECVNSFADMRARKTAPYPAEVTARIDVTLAAHQALEWAAPICGIMSA